MSTRLVESIAICVLAFIAVRVVEPQSVGRRIAQREAKVIDVLETIHAAQRATFAADQRYEWLSKLVDRAPQDSALATLRRVSDVPRDDVELFEVDDYYVVVALDDPDTNSGRDFAPTRAHAAPLGRREYQAFAWPVDYAETSEWAFFVSPRGMLIGTRNANGLFDGTQEPFPPNSHPLQEMMRALKEGDDGEWVMFKDLGEILAPSE
ncbi:MAG: hypothetical protein IPH13_07870 [Planctomycetes bacterium]|nr:hypothetical protein [Planctomycetota bacterium]